MTVIQDLQAVLIEALLREVTAEQAGRALDRLVRVVDGPAFVVGDDEDEAAAAWLAAAITRLQRQPRAAAAGSASSAPASLSQNAQPLAA